MPTRRRFLTSTTAATTGISPPPRSTIEPNSKLKGIMPSAVFCCSAPFAKVLRSFHDNGHRLGPRIQFGIYLLLALLPTPALSHPSEAPDVLHPHVFAFESAYSEDDPVDHLRAGGELLLGELNCTACHTASPDVAKHLLPAPAPDLTDVGSRLIYRDLWLFIRNPHFLRKGTTMPGLFSHPDDRDTEKVDALAQFLSTQKTAPEESDFPKGEAERGRDLYHSVGCIACHNPATDFDPPNTRPGYPVDKPGISSVPIRLGDLYRRDALTRFLLDPLASHPAGRMPSLKLSPQEASDIAAYLQIDGILPPDEIPPGEPEVIAKGKQLFGQLNCNACHQLDDPGIPAPPRARPLAELDPNIAKACLAEEPASGSPHYTLSPLQRRAISLALTHFKNGGGTAPPAPESRTDRIFAALNCYSCHERGGKGGPELPRAQYLAVKDPAAASLGEFGILPISLTGVGHKLTPLWLEKILAGGTGSVRPYMATRMPHFGKRNTAELLTLLPEVDRPDIPTKIDTTGLLRHQRAHYGRDLMGTQEGALGCVTCHGLKEKPSLGVPSINLTHAAQRLNPSYFKDLLLNPQELQFGTLMPPLFNGRKKTGQEIEQIWTYLKEIDQQQQLPPGLITTGDFELRPKERPTVFRTFLQGAGTQAVAVGFPEGLNAAFDAGEVRWALLWKGRFLDALSTWDERAATPATPLGTDIRALPTLAPLVNRKDFPAGTPWPDSKDVPRSFRGYRLSKEGTPTFLYSAGDLEVEETLTPTESGRLLRRVQIKGKGEGWLLLSLSKSSPVPLDLKTGQSSYEELLD